MVVQTLIRQRACQQMHNDEKGQMESTNIGHASPSTCHQHVKLLPAQYCGWWRAQAVVRLEAGVQHLSGAGVLVTADGIVYVVVPAGTIASCDC